MSGPVLITGPAIRNGDVESFDSRTLQMLNAAIQLAADYYKSEGNNLP